MKAWFLIACLVCSLQAWGQVDTELLERAIQGDAVAQGELGAAYLTGTGVPQDYAKAFEWCRRGAEQGDVVAQYGLSAMYSRGYGVPVDYVLAYMWSNLAAAQEAREEFANARDELAAVMRPEQIAEAQRLSREWLRRGQEQNSPEVATRGRGQMPDLDKIIRDAQQGDPWAQFALGAYYDRGGGGLPQDDDEAVKWYRRSADQGARYAQYFLGEMYADGRGVSQDDREAVKWYLLAAEQGYDMAQLKLGVHYQGGLGVPRDISEAVKWYLLAAEQGEPHAQGSLGALHFAGQGVPRDDVMAHMWSSLALKMSGKAIYIELRDAAAAQMTPDQIAEAQRLAREWRPKTWEELKPRD
jgi:uncharacterized protein